MSDDTARQTGACRCGTVQFSVAGPAMLTMACHCRGCQRLTGGPYSLSMAYPNHAFSHDAGELEVGGLHGASRYIVCAHCKSWLWTEPEGMGIVNVRTPMLDTPPSAPPMLEVATDAGFAWAKIGTRFSYCGMPSEEEYGEILAACAPSEPA